MRTREIVRAHFPDDADAAEIAMRETFEVE
jgi:hypothetical protein